MAEAWGSLCSGAEKKASRASDGRRRTEGGAALLSTQRCAAVRLSLTLTLTLTFLLRCAPP